MKNKLITGKLLDSLQDDLLKAAAAAPVLRPWKEKERQTIISIAADCLGIHDDRIPEIWVTGTDTIESKEYDVEKIRAVSWPGCAAAAHLYLPSKKEHRIMPLVLLCCGHGRGGKHHIGYRALARLLVRHGAAVLIPDNIGQGERLPMGHCDVIGPFAAGLSLQGMIVMETMAWLDWVLRDGRFDPERTAAAGNSGGGLITMLLAAFRRDHLAAVCSTGYPSTFTHIAGKEKKHCHCNILPGIIGKLEMWQLYGCFAPKPLFLLQGRGDHLFPEDLFHLNARRTAMVYHHAGTGDSFTSHVLPGGHSWTDEDRETIARYLVARFGAAWKEHTREDTCDDDPGPCYDPWPEDAHTADRTALELTGYKGPVPGTLADLICPEVPKGITLPGCRGELAQIAAQMQLFLKGHPA